LLTGARRRDTTHHSSLITHHCVVVGLIIAMLGGCGTTPQREAVSKTPPTTTRPGGYYLDDGPGAKPPADIDSIPDAVPRAEPLRAATSRPYVVMGKSYAPMTALEPYKARGIASWYGRRYHGKPTSSGEIYDMYAMTAAHTTLPIPSYARVTNPANGKSVVVRINDRGPFVDDRLIDLSYTAAHKLGTLAGGSAMVEVETIIPGQPGAIAAAAPPAPKPEPAPVVAQTPAAEIRPAPSAAPAQVPVAAGPAGFFLQLGAFGSKDNAESFLSRMRIQLDGLADSLHLFTRDGLFRVHAGPYASDPEARQAADRISQALGVRPFVLTR
jgi:rare lipoprotein A